MIPPTLRQLEVLLRAAGEAAATHAPLAPALRIRGGHLGAGVADALERGADLRSALAGMLPERQLDLLAGPRPPLEHAALMVAEDLRLARARRWRWCEFLAQPVLSLVIVLIYAVTVGVWGDTGLSTFWVLAAGLATAVLVEVMVIAGRPGLGRQMPWLGALGHHAGQAGRYERAALCARWRLPEDVLAPWLGADLAGLGPVLGRPDAEEHCRRLADWHRAATVRAQARVGRILALLLAIIAGCLVLASAVPAVQRVMVEQGVVAEDDDWTSQAAPVGSVAAPGDF